VSTLAACTFPDPVEAPREMGRFVALAATIRLLEHRSSNHRRIAVLTGPRGSEKES
jgi:hypothetical protein